MAQFSIHTISQKYGFDLADIIKNPDKGEVLAYGLEILLGGIVKGIVLFTSAMLLGIPYQVALLLLVTGSLRTLSGGAHCTAYYRCMLVSTGVMLAMGGLVKVLFSVSANRPVVVLGLMALSSLVLYWQNAPQAPLNKPLPDKVTENKFRLKSVGFAMFYAIASLALGANSWVSWCIALGMLWQAFTLTGPGHSLIGYLDKQLIFKGGEMK